MAKTLASFKISQFSTGLNVVDSTIDMPNSDLVTADNVIYLPTGEVQSVDGPLSVANDIRVNGVIATKQLGSTRFNGKTYLMASNDTVSRLLKLGTKSGSITAFADAGGGFTTVTSAAHTINNGDTVTISGTSSYNGTFAVSSVTANTFDIPVTFVADDATGTWIGDFFLEVVATNFDADADVEFEVYRDKMWFVNGVTDNGNVLHFLDTAEVLTGLTTSSGLEQGINHIVLHLERVWISKENKIFVSKQYPLGTNQDWDTDAYVGTQTAGLLQVDEKTDEAILKMVTQFGQLVIFRKDSTHVVSGKVILTSTIQKSFNATGVVASKSVSKADKNIFFIGKSGVKLFTGISVQEGTTEFDSVTTNNIDRRIKPLIDAAAASGGGLEKFVGFNFEDKYYLSDANNTIFVFDEITGGWSRWTGTAAENFVTDGVDLFYGKGEKFFKSNSDTLASVASEMRTKDYNLDTEQFLKSFEKLVATFRTLEKTHSFTLQWFIDGAKPASDTLAITVQGSSVNWDEGFLWDQAGIKWDAETINFVFNKKNKLKSGITIAFGVQATGTDRFSLNSLDLLFEMLRKGV